MLNGSLNSILDILEFSHRISGSFFGCFRRFRGPQRPTPLTPANLILESFEETMAVGSINDLIEKAVWL
jgi:hypothetical protein